jgi:hydrogenase nickel incorporation protein HypB
MEEKVRIIELHEDVFRKNNEDSDNLRKKLKEQGTLLINVMSSPGAGKTTLLRGIIRILKDKYNIGVLEADIDSDVDAYRIIEEGADSVQVHTGGSCHLTADMTKQGLNGFSSSKKYDLIFLENVGNLVCPAEFDTGATMNIMLLSVPEGDDKPLKYPLMFKVSQALIVTKIDVAPVFNFSLDKCEKYSLERNPSLKIFPVSAKRGDGMDELVSFIESKIQEQKA